MDLSSAGFRFFILLIALSSVPLVRGQGNSKGKGNGKGADTDPTIQPQGTGPVEEDDPGNVDATPCGQLPLTCNVGERFPRAGHCKQFYECQSGNKWKNTPCRGNRKYDSTTETCVESNIYDETTCFRCGQSSTQLPPTNTPTPEPGNDNSGAGSEVSTKSRTQADPLQSACNLPPSVCPRGLLLPDPKNCSQYQECLFNRWLKRPCPPGTKFDALTLRCHHANLATCHHPCPTEPTTTPLTTPLPPPNSRLECILSVPCLDKKVIAKPDDCSAYLSCFSGQFWTEVQCPESRPFFDWRINNCVKASASYECAPPCGSATLTTLAHNSTESPSPPTSTSFINDSLTEPPALKCSDVSMNLTIDELCASIHRIGPGFGIGKCTPERSQTSMYSHMHPNNCSKNFMCIGTVWMPGTCSSGYRYNRFTCACEPEDQVECVVLKCDGSDKALGPAETGTTSSTTITSTSFSTPTTAHSTTPSSTTTKSPPEPPTTRGANVGPIQTTTGARPTRSRLPSKMGTTVKPTPPKNTRMTTGLPPPDRQTTPRGTKATPQSTSSTSSSPVATLPNSEIPQYCEDNPSGSHLWKRTQGGSSRDGPCPGSMAGMATRRCGWRPGSGATWEDPDYSLCVSKPYKEISRNIEEIKNIPPEQQPGKPSVPPLKVEETITELTRKVKDDVDNSDGLTGGDLNVTLEALDVLTELADTMKFNFTDTQTMRLANTAGYVLSKRNKDGWEAVRQREPERGAVIMKTVDRIAEQMSKKLPSGNKMTLFVPNLEIKMESMVKESAFSFEFKPLPPPGTPPTGMLDKIYLDQATIAALGHVVPGRTISMWSTYYATLNEFLPTNDEELINSRILSLSVLNLPEGHELNPSVTLHFSSVNGSIDAEAMCKYWQFSRGGGEWDDEGCKVISNNASGTVCQCNHLTNFAVLMSPYPLDGMHETILSLISVIGCLLSILGMIITICLYILSWKRVKSHHAAVLINLCIALIIANTVFLAGINRTENQMICMAVAGMLHFFYLVAFFMMFADGVQFILYVVQVFHVRRKKETFLLILTCWFLPAVIVAITMSITKGEGYGTDDYCWLRKDNGLIAAFVAPALLVMIVNFCILCVILRTIANSKGSERKNRVKATIWNIAVMMPLLGLTWVFGLFSVNDETIYFQYIFAICNSLQGFFIFFFHCALNKKMRQAVVERFSTRSSQSSSLQERRHKKDSKEEQKALHQPAAAHRQDGGVHKPPDDQFASDRGARSRTAIHGTGRPGAEANGYQNGGTTKSHAGNEPECGVSYTAYGSPDSRSRAPAPFFYGGDSE